MLNFLFSKDRKEVAQTMCLRGKGNNQGKAPIKALLCKTMENRFPPVWVGKTMLDPTVGPDVTTNLEN